MPNVDVLARLHTWHQTVKKRDFPLSLVSASGFLLDTVVEVLGSVGVVSTHARFREVLGERWGWEVTYREELYRELKNMPMTPFVPCPETAKQASRKRTSEDKSCQSHDGQDIAGSGAAETQRVKKKKELVAGIPENMQVNFEVMGYTEDFSLLLNCMEQMM